MDGKRPVDSPADLVFMGNVSRNSGKTRLELLGDSLTPFCARSVLTSRMQTSAPKLSKTFAKRVAEVSRSPGDEGHTSTQIHQLAKCLQRLTDRKSLLALQGVGRASEAGHAEIIRSLSQSEEFSDFQPAAGVAVLFLRSMKAQIASMESRLSGSNSSSLTLMP